MKFSGDKWKNINNKNDKKYLLNAYRVLLTRARQGMVIFIPKGSNEDNTRPQEFYDGIHDYLVECGIDSL